MVGGQKWQCLWPGGRNWGRELAEKEREAAWSGHVSEGGCVGVQEARCCRRPGGGAITTPGRRVRLGRDQSRERPADLTALGRPALLRRPRAHVDAATADCCQCAFCAQSCTRSRAPAAKRTSLDPHREALRTNAGWIWPAGVRLTGRVQTCCTDARIGKRARRRGSAWLSRGVRPWSMRARSLFPVRAPPAAWGGGWWVVVGELPDGVQSATSTNESGWHHRPPHCAFPAHAAAQGRKLFYCAVRSFPCTYASIFSNSVAVFCASPQNPRPTAHQLAV